MLETIVAPATPYGESSIGVIRISGLRALEIVKTLTKAKVFKNRYAHYRKVYLDNNIIDDVIVTFYESPNTYTGEDLVEISCHGSVIIIRTIVCELVNLGCLMAEPGEFTKRAFINGKLDLLQAESITSIIKSKSDINLKNQQKILSGQLSSKLLIIKQKLLDVLSYFEHHLDIDEFDGDLEPDNYLDSLNFIQSELKNLMDSFSMGKLYNDGLHVVICGKPNVGKSTLFNRMLNSDIAITSSEPGTTRDIINAELNINGIPIKLFDTAGIRNSDNIVEKIGIDKAKKLSKIADLKLNIYDKKIDKDDDLNKNEINIINKCDELSEGRYKDKLLYCSAKNNVGIDLIFDIIKKKLTSSKSTDSATFITSSRQHLNIKDAYHKTGVALENIINNNINIEILSFELREALDSIDLILGKTTPDDIINNIFSHMCVGK
jgi:tRNA modification GTPase